MKVVAKNSFRSLATLASGVLAVTPAYALLRMNDGRDQVYVTFNTGTSYDSNIFTAGGGQGDFVFNSGLSIDYLRRAGLIGINGNLGWGFSKFDQFSSEDFSTPTMSLELTKSTGRTTGSLSLSASQSSKPDIDANVRTTAWNYSTGLSLRYPVIERYSLAGQFGYSLTDYTDNGTTLVDLSTYTASTDLYYSWTSERDLIFGYRYRLSETSANSTSTDHSFSTGVSGKLLAKLNGSARIGYQVRTSESSTGGADTTSNGINASVSSTWTVNRRLSLTGTLARDFNTTSTDSSTEGTTVTIDGQYAVNAKLSLNARASVGRNDYLDSAAANRQDNYYSYGTGFSYAFNPHLSISGSYDYFSNSSSTALSNFDRHIFSLNLSSRW